MSAKRPLGSVLTDLATSQPAAPAVTCNGTTTTYAELESAANRLARAYAQLGVGVGDMVTIGLPNGTEFCVAAFATWKLGAIPQPVSSRLPLRERQAIVDLADSRLVVGVEPGTHGERVAIPAGWTPPAGDGLDDSPLDPVVSPAWKAPTSGGSTGRPKLIVAAQPGVMNEFVGPFFGIEPGGTQLVAGPLYHNAPFMFAMIGLVLGQHLVVLPKFDAAAALDAIDRHGVEVTMVVPTMLSRMLRVLEEGRSGEVSFASIKRLWHMAAPCPDWLKRAWIELLGPERVFELYGGTEGQATTVIDGVQWLEHPGSVGRPATGEMIVLDEAGQPVPPGQVGEIYMRAGASAPATYRYVGAESRRRDDGWESIGDVGWMDEDGFVYLADRRADLILSGGANIYPAEVEGALLEHPAVGSCAVVGLPDDDLGQAAHAVVQLVAPGAATVEDLVEHLGSRLVRYKIPRSWDLVDEPVRDDAGKVRRSALAEEALRHQKG